MEKNSKKRKNDIRSKHGEANIEEVINLLNEDDNEHIDDIVD